MARRILAVLLLWLAALSCSLAQTPAPERWAELADTIFRTYGTEQGLPSSGITAVAEDADGFLWVGTQGGLARWDGYHFRVYHRGPAGSGALPDDFIWCLRLDDKGRLWIGTNGGGAARYEKETDRFVTYPAGPAGLGTVPVRSLAPDGAGGLWMGTGKGLVHLGPDGQPVAAYHHDEGLPADEVRSLLRDHAGALWVGTNAGIVRLDPGASAFTPVPLPGAEGSLTRAIIEASDGGIWIGTDQHGAYRLDPSGGPAKAVPDTAKTVDAIIEGSPGVIWLGTGNEGIVTVAQATGRTRHIRHDPTRPSSLPHDLLFSLYRDHSGLVWAATYSGLAMTDPTQDAILTAFAGSNQAAGLSAGDVPALLAAKDGKVWVSHLTGGLDIFDPDGHRAAELRGAAAPPDRVRAIAQPDRGDIYLGSYDGLYRMGPDGKGLTHLPLAGKPADPQILSLAGEGTGLWIGTRGQGLWRYDRADGRTRQLAAEPLADKWISTIAPAGDGKLWLGSFQGLYLLDPIDEQIRQFMPDLVVDLLKDRRGRLWVGTLGGGLAVIDGETVRRIGAAEGLAETNVATVLEDLSGRIWASGGNGSIYRIDPDSLNVTTLRRAEGVGLGGFMINAGAVTAQGNLLFGGDGGMVVVRPDRLKSWGWHPPIVVTDLRIGGKQMQPGGAGLDIQPDANSLSVEFSALDYSSPERNRYAYRLEGFDRGWIDTDAQHRLASYTNLPPGHYTLQLRGSNRDGAWGERTLDLPIAVLPAWYQTVAFKIVVAALAIFAIWMLVRFRTTYLRHRQIVLEQQVADRTVELQETVKHVAQSRAKVASLLDASGQGFLSFGPDLIVDRDYSRACETMLDGIPAGRPADQVLFTYEPAKAELFREAIAGAQAAQDQIRKTLLLSLLPACIERHGRRYKAEYHPLETGHIMVVLTDVTEEHLLANKVESERRRLEMIVAAVTESRDFFDAVESYRQFFRAKLMCVMADHAQSPQAVYQDIFRQIHTFKGTFAQLNFDATPKLLHALEDKLSALKKQEDGSTLTIGQIVEIMVSADYHGMLENDLIVLRNALGNDFVDQGKGVFLPMDQARRLRALAERVAQGGPIDDPSGEARLLIAEFKNLDKVSLADALKVYDRVIDQLAKRLHKDVSPLHIDGGEDIWLDPETYGPFLRSLVHIFRNAVIHGIETPRVRKAKGKPAAGEITCAIWRNGNGFTLAIADDGAGIDPNMILRRTRELDRISAEQAGILNDEEAVSLILVNAISGQDYADDLSGRGIGLAAIRTEVQSLSGTITVSSLPNHGARFEFSFLFSEQFIKQSSDNVDHR